jgi:hypothetical protein
MAMNTGLQQQQPLHLSASVRSAPSPQHGSHLIFGADATRSSTKPAAAAKPKRPTPPLEH